MNSSAPRILRPSRVVALALIALAVLGLAYLRYGSPERAVSVAHGAKAGDLTLASCEYETENGTITADCGTLVVPETRSDPQSRLIALPVMLVRAKTDAPKEPMFFLTGGPGESNIEFAAEFADRYVANRDFVVVGYRGAEGSVRLDCPERARRAATATSDTAFVGSRKPAMPR
jgi:hypothetical protein